MPWTGTPTRYEAVAPVDCICKIFEPDMSEARAKTGPRTNRNASAATSYDAHYDALTIPSPGVALVHVEHSARNGAGAGRRDCGGASSHVCHSGAGARNRLDERVYTPTTPLHATGWMSASSAPTARAKAATLARVCV